MFFKHLLDAGLVFIVGQLKPDGQRCRFGIQGADGTVQFDPSIGVVERDGKFVGPVVAKLLEITGGMLGSYVCLGLLQQIMPFGA